MPQLLEYIIIISYLVLLVVIGIVFKRFNRNTDDYFRSGARGSWWLVGTSIFMTGISSITFTANGGVAFRAGWSCIYIYVGTSIGLAISGLFLAAWYRQLRLTTYPEIVRLRYGEGFHQVLAYLTLVSSALGAAIPLWGLSIFCSTIFGIPIETVIVVLGIIVLLYSTTGGSWAVMGTDFLQGLILIPVTLLVSLLCLREVGGLGGFFNLIEQRELHEAYALVKPEGMFPNAEYSLNWIIAIVFVRAFMDMSAGAGVRFFAAKDGREAQKAAWLALGLIILGALIWFIPAITARLLWEDRVLAQALSEPAESAYAIASLNVLPSGMIGLMVVSMLGATMSTMDTGLNRNAAIVILDIYPSLCRVLGIRPKNSEELMGMSHAFSIIFGIIVIIIALYFASHEGAGMFRIMFTISAIVTFPVVIPTVLGMFVRKAPPWSGIFTFFFTLIPSAIAYFDSETWSLQRQLLVNGTVGIAAYMFTVFFWNRTSEKGKQMTEEFFRRMHQKVDFETEVGEANDNAQLNILGYSSLSVALFILLILLFPGNMNLSTVCSVLFVSGFCAAIGLILLYAARNAKPPS